MTKITIKLKLVESGKNDFELQWSNDGKTWSKVTERSPKTVLESGDELDWDADDSIKKIKIKFKKGNIIANKSILENDTKCPRGGCGRSLAMGLKDTYTIKVQPANGGAIKEYDPIVETPQPSKF